MQIYSLNGALTCPGKGRVASLVDRTYKKHIDDILGDGGAIPNQNLTREWVQFRMRRNPAEIALDIHPDATGIKIGAAAGQLSKLYSINREGDLLQTVGGSQPVVHEWRGENHWSNQGVVGNYISTPNAPINQITGNIDISAKINLKSGLHCIVAKDQGSGSTFRVFRVRVTSFGAIDLVYSIDGSTVIVSTSTVGDSGMFTSVKHIRVTRVAATGLIKFYTSTNGATWLQLGADVLGTAGNLANINTALIFGAYGNGGSGEPINGLIYSVQIYNGIRENGGVLAVNFNANDYRKADPTDQSGWNASITNERYTINTDANATGIKGVLVDGTQVQFEGIDDWMTTALMNFSAPVSGYLVTKIFNNTADSDRRIYDGFNGFPINRLAITGATGNLSVTSVSGINSAAQADVIKKLGLISTIHDTEGSISLNGTLRGAGPVGRSVWNGVTIGAARSGAGSFINAAYKTMIFTKTADTPGQQADTNAFISQLNKRLY